MIVQPKSFEKALKHEIWNKAIEEETKMIKKNETQKLTDLPSNEEVIRVKRAYKTKLNSDGLIQKHKA